MEKRRILECKECTACCTMFYVKEINKPSNTECIYCDKGCTIHDNKPLECSNFNCAYVQMKKENINLRPDNCGIIFEKHSDRIFHGTLVTDKKISHYGNMQIKSFLKQGYSVVLSSIKDKTTKFLISNQHNEIEIKEEFRNIVNGYLQYRFNNINNC